MNYPLLSDDIIYNATDVTAGVFLVLLICSITVQSERRPESGHLLASAILELAGIFARIVAGAVEIVPDDFVWQSSAHILPPVPVVMIWILSFLFIVIGIEEAATYVIYVNGGRSRSSVKTRLAASGIVLVAGTVLYVCTGNINTLTIANLALFAFCFFHIYICCSGSGLRQFRRASLIAIITFVIPFIFKPVRLTGLGLSVMLLILNEQYHGHLERELAENEAELAKGRVQRLAEQISPHYIYITPCRV